MDAGQLDQRITLQEALTTTDALNAKVINWITLADVWAQVREVQGREFLKGDSVQAEGKATFTIRFRTGLDSALHRVAWRGRFYGIEDITGTRREGFLWLHCRSVQSGN